MTDATLSVALVTEVFFDDEAEVRLRSLLSDAARKGAQLVVLPELPLNEWSPYSKVAREEDAEGTGGPRQRSMASAARDTGVALLGGAIVRDTGSGVRHNTALLYDAEGGLMAAYRKVHLPEEEGYWETSHYEPGDAGPRLVRGLPLDVGLQICSDVNRPQGFQLLAGQGAEVVLAPRATPPDTYERWKLILRANAIMSGAYVVSANRPRPEHGASIGGPSLVLDPFGEVVVETTEPVAVAELRREVVEAARLEYPGYLERFPALYAAAWTDLADPTSPA